MRSCTPQPAFLSTVSSVGVFSVFEVEADLIETLFRNEVFTLGAQVAAIDYGVDKLIGVGAKIAAAFDAPNTFEAEGVPDAAGSYIGFVDEIEDGVSVTLEAISYCTFVWWFCVE